MRIPDDLGSRSSRRAQKVGGATDAPVKRPPPMPRHSQVEVAAVLLSGKAPAWFIDR